MQAAKVAPKPRTAVWACSSRGFNRSMIGMAWELVRSYAAAGPESSRQVRSELALLFGVRSRDVLQRFMDGIACLEVWGVGKAVVGMIHVNSARPNWYGTGRVRAMEGMMMGHSHPSFSLSGARSSRSGNRSHIFHGRGIGSRSSALVSVTAQTCLSSFIWLSAHNHTRCRSKRSWQGDREGVVSCIVQKYLETDCSIPACG